MIVLIMATLYLYNHIIKKPVYLRCDKKASLAMSGLGLSAVCIFLSLFSS